MIIADKKYLDADECTLGTHTCHKHATCSNTDGSYTCQCEVGYTGDGFSCEGKIQGDNT